MALCSNEWYSYYNWIVGLSLKVRALWQIPSGTDLGLHIISAISCYRIFELTLGKVYRIGLVKGAVDCGSNLHCASWKNLLNWLLRTRRAIL